MEKSRKRITLKFNAMKRQYLNLLSIFFVFSLFSCSKDDNNETATANDIVLLYNNVKIIDSLSLPLNMDNTLLNQGKYEFSFIGNAPNISNGDIIIGAQGKGFIRKIVSSVINGNTISFETIQGSMSNVFKDGKFRLLLNSESARSASSLGNFSHIFNSQNLFQSGAFTLVLNQGEINYNSNWVFDFEFENLGLKYFEMSLKDAILNATMTTTLTASQSVNLYNETLSLIQGSRKMWTKTFLVPAVLVGVPVLVPVKINVDYDILLNYTTTFDAELSRSGTFTSNNVLNLGIKYSEGQWTDLNNFNTNNGFSLSSYNGNANITSNLSVTPRFDIKLYGVLGPYLIAGPKCEFVGNVHLPLTPFSDSDFEINGSLISNLGAEVKILDETLVDKSLGPFETSKVSLYKLPNEISKVSGDNQIGTFSQPLPNSLKIKVTDSEDLPSKNIAVHFKIEEGNGDFGSENEKIVLTDNQGVASVSWTLGNAGSQKVSAIVKKANGTIINQSLEFTATAGCTSDITDIDGNSYTIGSVGSLCVMQQDLKVSHFKNGDDIPQSSVAAWNSTSGPAWCSGPNGKLYNYAAVSDPRGLAPDGWHVLYYSEAASIASNSSNFNASITGILVDCQICFSDDYLYNAAGYWWLKDTGSAILTHSSSGFVFPYLAFANIGNTGNPYPIQTGCAVRCIKD